MCKMFKVEISNTDKKSLRFLFDLAVPPEAQDTPEFSDFFAGIASIPGVEMDRHKGELFGFTTPLDGWLAMIEKKMPFEDVEFQRDFFSKLPSRAVSGQKDELQINFHQQSFDTPGRYWAFVLNQGHFPSYFLNRLYWYLAPKNEIVTSFPLHVDVETANTCNMKCPMCYRHMLKEVGQMEMPVFQKIIDECAANNVFSVRLSWRGEPLTHPRIKEMIAYAAARIKNVSFLTNAFYIDDEVMDCLIENRLSYLAVSFDGIGEIYEAVRAPAKFKENYKRLQKLLGKRKEAGSRLPQVRVCTVWPAIRENPEAYARTMEKVSDYMVKNPYINFAGPMTIKPDFICQYPWERIVVAFNGKAQCCTGWNADDIILGNVMDKSVKEMWLSPRMDRIRELHAQGGRMRLSSCSKCRHGAKGDPDIEIHEIINRGY
ncbi:MAG: radical SAM/SPASM domain-containing protein [Thermodesulfobacteriota bacterium]|nr:radical SAM/SPASM domain-containing protein [Thermodesulfobacteriota bacterium]